STIPRGQRSGGPAAPPTDRAPRTYSQVPALPRSSAPPLLRSSAPAPSVRYASVWEDADVLCEALAPVSQGGRLLSIASAGDNVLALLTLDPAEVVAIDTNPAQLACLELRRAAFRRLDDP